MGHMMLHAHTAPQPITGKRRRPSLVDTKRSAMGSRRKMFSLDDGLEEEPMSARDRKRGRMDDDEEFVIDGMRPKSRRLRDQAMGVRRPSDRNLMAMDRGAMNKRLKAVRVRYPYTVACIGCFTRAYMERCP